ncbi:secretoglobin family 3A member 2 [Camelus dromedarius]|uniref:secretoglobin family 3A member 2 n=1 Tax=Camelus dromedarius TaxID=9838 RepID=UPI00057BAAC0|nr:secretoglobin family 3A member 2-like [Camelus dromedarius]
MKLVTVFLLVAISICSYSASALVLGVLSPVSSVSLVPVDKILPLLGPLKLLLKTLGISVEHLLEGLRKCVNELGPEAADSVKKLLEALSYLV